MFTSLEKLIQQAIALKTGNREFALFGDADGIWEADIGNECPSVMLGEIRGEVTGRGATPKRAVSDLIRQLKAH